MKGTKESNQKHHKIQPKTRTELAPTKRKKQIINRDYDTRTNVFYSVYKDLNLLKTKEVTPLLPKRKTLNLNH